ncbi:hypothetical protein IJ579_06755 [bacterium]|nr:hypothetical protein [bacterium]
MKEDKEIEKILLNDKAYEKFLNTKIEKEFSDITDKVSQVSQKTITDIKDVPVEMLFCKNTTYLVMNKESKTKSYINGIQAEGLLGTDNTQRKKLCSKEVDYFVSDNIYVKFYKLKV